MSKPLREIIQGVTYHCYTRCHGKRNLLQSSYARRYLIESIIMCQEKYTFDLIAAESVGNHIHIIIKTVEEKETISKIMQYIKARVAEKYNRSTGETGSFWNERFGSKIIEKSDDPENYLLWLLWYIGYNPVRKGLSRNPRDNQIGFINCYLINNYKSLIKFTLHQYFINLGITFEERVKKFLKYEDIYMKRLAFYC